MKQANRKPIRIDRVWAIQNKNTFKIKPIEQLIRETIDLSLLWIDPFANQNKIASIINDLNMQFDTDYHLDALDFLRQHRTKIVREVRNQIFRQIA